MSEEIENPALLDGVDFYNPLILETQPSRDQKYPIMVSLGSAQITTVDIQNLLVGGMTIARLLMASCSKEERKSILLKIEEAAINCSTKYGIQNWPIATCVSLKNLLVKTGILEKNKNFVLIEDDSEITLTNDLAEFDKCSAKKIFVNNPMLTSEIEIGTEISIEGIEIVAKCTEIIDHKSIKCKVLKGGILRNLGHFCARNFKHERPFISHTDLDALDFVIENEIDILIMSYVQDAENVKEVKKYFEDKKHQPVLFSGIATMKGLQNIDEILQESKGLVLFRDHLPYELSEAHKYRFSNIQKWLAGKCYQVGKPLFVSSGCFELAMTSGTFGFHHISDIETTILDGVTGFLFIKEVYTEAMINILIIFKKIFVTVDPVTVNKSVLMRLVEEIQAPVNAAEAAVLSCALAARQTNACMIILPTVSGRTVQMMQMMKPSCTILTVSSKKKVCRLLLIYRGVIPLLYDGPNHSSWESTMEAHLSFALEYATKRHKASYGDTYVVLRRSSEYSLYCDMVFLDKFTLRTKPKMVCPVTTLKRGKKKIIDAQE